MCSVCQIRPHFYYIDARDMQAGKIYKDRRGRKFDSFLMAYRQLEEMRSHIDNGIFDPSAWVPSMLKEYKFKIEAENWLAKLKRDKSHAYVRHCRSYMKHHILPELGDYDVRDIRRRHIEDLYYKLVDKKLAPKTIKGILSTVKTLMKRLYELEVTSRELSFPVVKVPEKPVGWINREKQALVLSFIPKRHRLIFETLIETAERPSEVCAHKKKDLLDGELMIERAFDETRHIKESKTGRIIYRGITLELWGKLTGHAKDKLPEAWLFIDSNGEPYHRDRLYRIWSSACKKVGIEISLYAGTRHSRASQKRLEKEKQVAEDCRQELGHSSSYVTMKHYARDRREEI